MGFAKSYLPIAQHRHDGRAPVGVQSIVHPEGELASARAAAAVGVPYIHSTAASHSIEQVAEARSMVPELFTRPIPATRAGRTLVDGI